MGRKMCFRKSHNKDVYQSNGVIHVIDKVMMQYLEKRLNNCVVFLLHSRSTKT
jgi:hypothetical protein